MDSLSTTLFREGRIDGPSNCFYHIYVLPLEGQHYFYELNSFETVEEELSIDIIKREHYPLMIQNPTPDSNPDVTEWELRISGKPYPGFEQELVSCLESMHIPSTIRDDVVAMITNDILFRPILASDSVGIYVSMHLYDFEFDEDEDVDSDADSDFDFDVDTEDEDEEDEDEDEEDEDDDEGDEYGEEFSEYNEEDDEEEDEDEDEEDGEFLRDMEVLRAIQYLTGVISEETSSRTSESGGVDMKTLEKVKIEGGEREKDCAVCLEEFTIGLEATRLPCSHIFHDKCIGRWFENRDECPLCRDKVPHRLGLIERNLTMQYDI